MEVKKQFHYEVIYFSKVSKWLLNDKDWFIFTEYKFIGSYLDKG